MPSVNLSPINLTVTSATRSVDARTTITAGDSDCYQLTVTFSDVTSISGTCQMRFVLADGTYYDRDDSDGVTITDNAVSYMLESAFYTAPGLVCWVQFIDSNLHTQLRIGFPKIRVTGATTEASTAESYPTWAADMRELDFAIGTVETLEPGADATASITGDIPDKVLNLGIPQGDKGDAATVAVGTVTTLDAGESATVANSGTSAAAVLDFGIPKGDKGDAGEMTIGTVTTLAPGESATVTNSGTSTDAVLDIGIPAGYDGSAVPIDDASSAADRVLSAQYIKGQLSAIAARGAIISDTSVSATYIDGTWTADSATDVLTCSADHGLSANDPVSFVADTGVLPTGISAEPEFYYVESAPTTKTIKIKLTRAGAAVDITADGTAGWKIRKASVATTTNTMDFSLYDEYEIYHIVGFVPRASDGNSYPRLDVLPTSAKITLNDAVVYGNTYTAALYSATASKKYVSMIFKITIRKLASSLYAIQIDGTGLFSDNIDLSGATAYTRVFGGKVTDADITGIRLYESYLSVVKNGSRQIVIGR